MMKVGRNISLLLICMAIASPSIATKSGPKHLDVFAGSVVAPVLRELIPIFEEHTGATVRLQLGGSGAMLSRVVLSGHGDVYLPGSSDFMELAKERKLVEPSSERRLAYIVPTLCVAAGNPKNIQSLSDLEKPGIKLAIGRPDSVCVGLYGVEVLERAGLAEKVLPNIVTYTESCAKTAQVLSMGLVDAILGWDVFSQLGEGTIKTIRLLPNELARVGYIPVAVLTGAKEPELAALFVELLASEKGRETFRRNSFTTEVSALVGDGESPLKIGGRYELPERWK